MAAKRQSLASFSPKPQPVADGATVTASTTTTKPELTEGRKGPKYPHVTVYLRPEEVRTLKLLSIETDTKMSDICAEAVREWLERNGHTRTGKLKSDA